MKIDNISNIFHLKSKQIKLNTKPNNLELQYWA